MRDRNHLYYEEFADLFFVTSTIVGFINLFDIDECCNILINSLAFCQARGDFTILAYVIMPNHFHLIAGTKPDGCISKTVGNIKRFTSHQIVKYLECNDRTDLLGLLAAHASKEPSADCRIWKPHFDCFAIIKEDTLRQKLEYIHSNPVRKNLVADPVFYRFSSAGNYAGAVDVTLAVDTAWESIGYTGKDSVRRDS